MNTQNGKWVRTRTEIVADLKLFRARFDYLRNPRNQNIERMVVLEGADSANIVPVNARGEILFVRQYRVGIQQEILELPGGLVDPGESPAQAASRELAEETGHTSIHWTQLGRVASNPVFMDNYVHHYLALRVMQTQSLQLDPGESITLEWLSGREAKRRLHQGAFMHPHTISALTLFFSGSWIADLPDRIELPDYL